MTPFRAFLACLVLACTPFAFHPALAGDGKAVALTISNAWSRATVGTVRPAVAYLTITNAGKTPDRLVAAESPVAGQVYLHRSVMEGGIMKMKPVNGIEIPAGGSVTLKPGGYHLMLMGLKKPLKKGEALPLALTFEKAGKVDIKLHVRALGASKGTKGMGGHGH